MSSSAVFFDRDNTLIVSDGYLGDPAGVVLVPGAAQAIARVRELGYRVVTVSNQSGVARGLFGEEAVEAVNQRMEELLERQNHSAVIDRHEFCPFHPQAAVEKYRQDSDLRKPRPGMIQRAARVLNLDLANSWMVGDAPRDIEAGIAAGCKTIWVVDPALAPSPDATAKSGVRADAVVKNLGEAVEVIAATKNQLRRG
jgi:D-glycero-D-manno-heptose 1,7-bisphosphate phosphatase